jgi:Fe-S cluster biosynthesis and repair protein YggX
MDMKKNEVFTLFDRAYVEMYKEEHGEKETKKYSDNIYKEIYKKVSKYNKEDWKNIKEKANYIYEDISILMDKPPSHRRVQEAVGDLRQYFSDSFYDCNLKMFRGIGNLYVNDENFRENINKRKSGLAEFIKEAIEIYCNDLENI